MISDIPATDFLAKTSMNVKPAIITVLRDPLVSIQTARAFVNVLRQHVANMVAVLAVGLESQPVIAMIITNITTKLVITMTSAYTRPVGNGTNLYYSL